MDQPKAAGVELAATVGPKLGRRVFVLSSSAWSQTVSLPSESIRGLSQDELAKMLNFEAESLSGLSAFESSLAFHQTSNSEFLITQIAQAELSTIRDMITSRGSKFQGLASPVGVPSNVQGNATWNRVEYWSSCVCHTSSESETPDIINTDPRSDRWRGALTRPDAFAQASVQLYGPDLAWRASDATATCCDLSDQKEAEQWLTAWATILTGSASVVPVIQPAAAGNSNARRKSSTQLLAAAMVATLCLAHWIFVKQTVRNIHQDLEKLKAPIATRKKYNQQRLAAEKQRDLLRKQLSDVGSRHSQIVGLENHRHRWVTLLRLLSEQHSSQMVITRIEYGPEGLTVMGRSVDAQSAGQLAGALRPSLRRQGWIVEPPSQEGQNALDNGGPWSFRILMRDVSPQDAEAESGRQFADSKGQ